jgi:hypothetical protein
VTPHPPDARPGFPGTGPAGRPLFPVVVVGRRRPRAARRPRRGAPRHRGRRARGHRAGAGAHLAELVECSVDVVAQICAELAAEYERDARGFVLAEVAGGYRYQTHPDVAPYVEQFVLEGQHVRCRAPRSRPSRSSPTSSRSPAARSRRSAA